MWTKQIVLIRLKLTVLLLVVSLAKGFQNEGRASSTIAPNSPRATAKNDGRLNSGTLLQNDKKLSPVQQPLQDEEGNNLVEVKEEDIPEGSVVYVLEEPVDVATDGETLKTASNIVFRPLFRYRSKQEAQRRNSNRYRRRYYVPRRSYRQTYYPYYYPNRYYY